MSGTIRLGGREIPYLVRHSVRARRVSLRIREAGLVEVVVPRLHLLPSPESVVKRHEAWILRTFDRLSRTGAAVEPQLCAGSRLFLLGRERTIRVVREERRRSTVILTDEEINLFLPPGHSGDIRYLLQRWIRARAEADIPARVSELARPWDFRYASVTVRNQRTRWGSCSRKGTLSFNWRLLILPPEVADYLIYHELAHLRHMDHSPKFWSLVRTLCPGFRESERWLRRNGRSVPL